MGKFYSNQPNQNIIMQRKLEKICGLSDEQILREFEKAQKNTRPLPIKPPPADEFERICRRVEAERRKILTAPQRVKWKRVAAVGLLAAALTGSGCFVALGKKSYFYRERIVRGHIVLNSDSDMLKSSNEELAYDQIESDLDINPIKLGYKPTELIYNSLFIENGIAYLKFNYHNEYIYLIESKYDKTASYNYRSDFEVVGKVQNNIIGHKMEIFKEVLSNGEIRYATSIIIDGVYYSLSGTMEQDIFEKMVKTLMF